KPSRSIRPSIRRGTSPEGVRGVRPSPCASGADLLLRRPGSPAAAAHSTRRYWVCRRRSAPFAFTAPPGTYTLVGHGSAPASACAIQSDGRIDYGPRFDNFLSGRGTSRLVIHGFPE